jgi:hypothetical protein
MFGIDLCSSRIRDSIVRDVRSNVTRRPRVRFRALRVARAVIASALEGLSHGSTDSTEQNDVERVERSRVDSVSAAFASLVDP